MQVFIHIAGAIDDAFAGVRELSNQGINLCLLIRLRVLTNCLKSVDYI